MYHVAESDYKIEVSHTSDIKGASHPPYLLINKKENKKQWEKIYSIPLS